ncbi:MAG: DnaD domain protein [Bacilli bacterium]|nr:DnaD domain protein [Bacilli bacterium]
MARKRMFDTEIITQDSFLDLPMESKALYFLLGMEADDEGFVNPNKVLRLYGGTQDGIKVLIAKEYIIPFKSGVVVITDWNTNNWLDKRRSKNTIYLEEKTQLKLDKNTNKYILAKPMLSECLESIEENRVEEYRIEENRTTTTKDINIYEIVEKNFGRTISPMEFEKINNWLLLFNEDILNYAIELCVLQNKKTFAYLEGILKNWKSQQYKTLEEIKDNEISKTEKPKERTYL